MENNGDPKQLIIDRVKQATNILVTVENDPSVDELAAALALTVMLNKMDKHATAVFSGAIPPAINFLEPTKTFESTVDSLRDFIIALDREKADRLRYKVEGDVVKIYITPYQSTISEKDLRFSQGDFNVELVLALGVEKRESLDRAIAAHGRILHDATVVTINAANEHSSLGVIDWQDAKASSICEMLVGLCQALQPKLLDTQMSTALLTGIVAATGRFGNDHTTPHVMTIAAELMAAGANPELIANNLQRTAEKKPESSGKIKRDAAEPHGGEVPQAPAKPAEKKPEPAGDGSKGEMKIWHEKDQKPAEATGPGAGIPTAADELTGLKEAVESAAAKQPIASPKPDSAVKPAPPVEPKLPPLPPLPPEPSEVSKPESTRGFEPPLPPMPPLPPGAPNAGGMPPLPPLPAAPSMAPPSASTPSSPFSNGGTPSLSAPAAPPLPPRPPIEPDLPKITPLGQNLESSSHKRLEPPTLGGTLNATTAEAEEKRIQEAEEEQKHNNVTLSHGEPVLSGSGLPSRTIAPPSAPVPAPRVAAQPATTPSSPFSNGGTPSPSVPAAPPLSPRPQTPTPPPAPAPQVLKPAEVVHSPEEDLENARKAVVEALADVDMPDAPVSAPVPMSAPAPVASPSAPVMPAPALSPIPPPPLPSAGVAGAPSATLPPLPDFANLPSLPGAQSSNPMAAPALPGGTDVTSQFTTPGSTPGLPSIPAAPQPPVPPAPGQVSGDASNPNQFRIPGQ